MTMTDHTKPTMTRSMRTLRTPYRTVSKTRVRHDEASERDENPAERTGERSDVSPSELIRSAPNERTFRERGTTRLIDFIDFYT